METEVMRELLLRETELRAMGAQVPSDAALQVTFHARGGSSLRWLSATYL